MPKHPWYKRYPGDYVRDTNHLSMIEHGAYNLLLDAYYATGEPLPHDGVYRIARASTEEEIAAVEKVLRGFWQLGPDNRWTNKRAERELSASRNVGEPTTDGPKRTRRKPRQRSRKLAEARARGRHSDAQWEALLDACNHRCVSCGSDAPLVRGHIVPIHRNGDDSIGNIQPLCRSCTSRKHTYDCDLRPPEWLQKMSGLAEPPAPAESIRDGDSIPRDPDDPPIPNPHDQVADHGIEQQREPAMQLDATNTLTGPTARQMTAITSLCDELGVDPAPIPTTKTDANRLIQDLITSKVARRAATMEDARLTGKQMGARTNQAAGAALAAERIRNSG